MTTDDISDGYHTFGELYEHRSILFIALMSAYPQFSWFSRKHHDGSMDAGFFIAGMNLPTGQITYHLRTNPWWRVITNIMCIDLLPCAPAFDGHTPEDVIDRIIAWLSQPINTSEIA